jgi:hypothetical protein
MTRTSTDSMCSSDRFSTISVKGNESQKRVSKGYWLDSWILRAMIHAHFGEVAQLARAQDS